MDDGNVAGTLGKSQTLLIDKSTWITWLKSRQAGHPPLSSAFFPHVLSEIGCGVRGQRRNARRPTASPLPTWPLCDLDVVSDMLENTKRLGLV